MNFMISRSILLTFGSLAIVVLQVNAEYFKDDKTLLPFGTSNILSLTVSTASGVEEKYRDSPDSMMFITDKQLKLRGYTNIDEVIMDLPRFNNASSEKGISLYHSGYRTFLSQQILFMINGQVNRDFWAFKDSLTKAIPITNIARIEVIYGPVGVGYSSNTFLGSINLITKKAFYDDKNGSPSNIKIQVENSGSKSIDMVYSGEGNEFVYNVSTKYNRGNESRRNDNTPWDTLKKDKFSNQDIQEQVTNKNVLSTSCNSKTCLQREKKESGESFNNTTSTLGFIADLRYRHLKLGVHYLQMKNRYDPFYSRVRKQSGSSLSRNSSQYFIHHFQPIKPGSSFVFYAEHQESQAWGRRTEAIPGSIPLSSTEATSSPSLSDFHSAFNSNLVKWDYQNQYNATLLINAGIKYENQQRSEVYNGCRYWTNISCSPSTGATIDTRYKLNNNDKPRVPSAILDINFSKTTSKGGYIQATWNFTSWRINGGIRYDKHDFLGDSIKHRLSAIYHQSKRSSLKLIYDNAAYKESAPIELRSELNHHEFNSKPQHDKIHNMEFIMLYQQNNWLHNVSLFTAMYENEFREDNDNAGNLQTWGGEYRGNFQFDNFIQGATKITGHFYYTYTNSYSSFTHLNELNLLQVQEIKDCTKVNSLCLNRHVETEPISHHNINVGLNLPLNKNWNANLSFNWFSHKNDTYGVLDANILYQFDHFSLAFKVKNIFKETSDHSETRNSDPESYFNQPSLDSNHYLIPQVTRNFMLMLSFDF